MTAKLDLTILQLGAIVHCSDPVQRGVVIGARGRGDMSCAVLPTERTCVVKLAPGLYVSTDNVDGHWTPVPREDATALERVWSADATWEPPVWLEDDEEPSDLDTHAWSVLSALLPDDLFEEANRYDARTTFEMAEEVARWIDVQTEAARSLASLRRSFRG